MKIRVQSIHFSADVKLLDFIQKKADKLDQFFDHIISGEVYLRLENTEDEANKITEIKLLMKKADEALYRAKEKRGNAFSCFSERN